jgi:hypothetical protein
MMLRLASCLAQAVRPSRPQHDRRLTDPLRLRFDSRFSWKTLDGPPLYALVLRLDIESSIRVCMTASSCRSQRAAVRTCTDPEPADAQLSLALLLERTRQIPDVAPASLQVPMRNGTSADIQGKHGMRWWRTGQENRGGSLKPHLAKLADTIRVLATRSRQAAQCVGVR